MKSQSGLEEVGRSLHSNALHLMRYVRTEDSAMGIGPAQASALSVVVFGGPTTLNQLAEAEQVKPPTMSRVVEALVGEGLAKREENKDDRRSVIISATEKGTKIIHEGRDRREKRLIGLLAQLGQDDIRCLKKASKILSEVLGLRHD
ncbi:MAG TPA: MarR family transcriptional regulator [Candidatus Bathyarchaeia archaeon]|jgi:DNA-binding MarR family transcriptional regulator|nr:MarR family transcriptional regulator [Candidatus Bathyarchaeia archaeon]